MRTSRPEEISSTIDAATSTATITMPDYFGNLQTQTLNDGFGNITQVSQRVQANGVLQQSCLIRA